jgi:hypothetical protein
MLPETRQEPIREWTDVGDIIGIDEAQRLHGQGL